MIDIYSPFTKLDFNFKHCLFTGQKLLDETEFISLFPSWMIDKYELNGKKITFLNGEAIEYQNIKIPVSLAAQNQGLNAMLGRVSVQLQNEHQALRYIEPDDLYLFMVYIFWGVLYYECFTALKKPRKETEFLFKPGFSNRFQILHIILSSLLRKTTYEGFEPESLVVFKLHDYPGTKSNFDLKISANTMTMSMRLGNLGILAGLLDNGVQKHFFESYFDKFAYQVLHPIQFDELYAKLSYKSYLMNITYEYGLQYADESNTDLVLTMRVPEEQKETPIFKPWDETQFGHILTEFLRPYGISQAEIMADNKIITFLERPDGEAFVMDREGNELID